MMYRSGLRGHPCLTPFWMVNASPRRPLTLTRIVKSVYVICKAAFQADQGSETVRESYSLQRGIDPAMLWTVDEAICFFTIKDEEEARSVAAVAIAEEELAKGRCLPMNVFSLRKPTCALER